MRRQSSHGLRRARGVALLEMLVSLTLFGIVLAAFGGLLARHERAHATLDARLQAAAQLREGEGALAHDLLPLAPSAGDLAPGEARDSAIALRAVVATGIACDTAGLSIALPPATGDPLTSLLARLTMPQRFDTLWAWADGAEGRSWVPLQVAGVATSGARCQGGLGPLPLPGGPRLVLTVGGVATLPAGIAAGTPLRITRRVRWSLYRASDRRWWLGWREQSAGSGALAAVQPVVGPLRGYSADSTRSGAAFHYYDAAGVALAPGLADTRAVARIRVVLRADTLVGRAAPGAPAPRESIVTLVAPRG
ncbi:MAG: PulJ/GspJ family protein [Gemmatimonadaceae bacterium]